MLYKILKRTIQRYINENNSEDLNDLKQKLDVFLTANKITAEQYEELMSLSL